MFKFHFFVLKCSYSDIVIVGIFMKFGSLERRQRCAINAEHVKVVRKKFKFRSKNQGQSPCALLHSFYGLPRDCVLIRAISPGQSFVYFGRYESHPAYIKVSNIDLQHINSVTTHEHIFTMLSKIVQIPRLLAHGWKDDIGVVVLSEIKGQSLASQVGKRIPLRRRVKCMKSLGVALGKMHRVVTHGDLHFNNILVTPSGKIAMIDWDDAVVFSGDSKSKLSEQQKTICRQYDIYKVVYDILASVFNRITSTANAQTTTSVVYVEVPEYVEFMISYQTEVQKWMPLRQVKKRSSEISAFLDKRFRNRVFGPADPEMSQWMEKKFRPIYVKAVESAVKQKDIP